MNSAGRLLIFVLCLLQQWGALAQTATLSGVVKDKETGETLPGATVLLVGTYVGTSTDLNGRYEITGIKPGDYSVKFSFVGYSDQLFNGIRLSEAKPNKLDATLAYRSSSLDEVVIVGDPVIDLESAKSEIKISADDIKEMTVRNVQDVVKMQAGVSQNPDGIQIRGGRVYETQYVVDGISAQDPLAGTGFGVNVAAGAVSDVKVVTGGAGAEYGDGSSGVVSTTLREGGDKFEMAGNWSTDNFFTNRIKGPAWNTDVVNLSLSTPIPFTKGKLTLFTTGSAELSDTYFGAQANQLHSSLFKNPDPSSEPEGWRRRLTSNDSTWAPRQDNRWSNTLKLAYTVRPGFKFFLSNQHSISINQNTRTLQIVGFDAVVQPGFQYSFSENLDNAITYTHRSNLSVAGLTYSFPNNKITLTSNLGRLFTNLRADANGRPFRSATVDQIYDPESIVTDPITLFNPSDSIVYVNAPTGLINNGGIGTDWHDHFAIENTLRNVVRYYPANKYHQFAFGQEHKELEYQWVDVTRPWVGAPIAINDSTTTASISVGSSNDIWRAKAASGGVFVEDQIAYKGIRASLGLRFNYWALGKFMDDAVANPDAFILDEVRRRYLDRTVSVLGRRFQARLLPRINVSFPVTENNVLYFNYGHSMRQPHPRFVYAGLDPEYQDRGYLSRLGNPDLKPETTVSYELGFKSQITKNAGITLAAFNNDKYDYIVTRTAVIADQTGRLVDRTTSINQDYARIVGIEMGLNYRVGRYVRTFFNGAYQVATGKSNSAAESLLQIRQTGFVNTTKEQFLAWDRPWDFKAGAIFSADTSVRIGRVSLNGFKAFVSGNYKSGLRYTPHELTSIDDLGRPIYTPIVDQPNAEVGSFWLWFDVRISREIIIAKKRSVQLSAEVTNILNRRNAQIINPVTGTAYESGDPVPATWRDPAYPNPLDDGVPPTDPARYTEPRHFMFSLSFTI